MDLYKFPPHGLEFTPRGVEFRPNFRDRVGAGATCELEIFRRPLSCGRRYRTNRLSLYAPRLELGVDSVPDVAGLGEDVGEIVHRSLSCLESQEFYAHPL